jgi:hypothetical protein
MEYKSTGLPFGNIGAELPGPRSHKAIMPNYGAQSPRADNRPQTRTIDVLKKATERLEDNVWKLRFKQPLTETEIAILKAWEKWRMRWLST